MYHMQIPFDDVKGNSVWSHRVLRLNEENTPVRTWMLQDKHADWLHLWPGLGDDKRGG